MLINIVRVSAQDSIYRVTEHKSNSGEEGQLYFKQIITPSIFIGYGMASLKMNGLKRLNFSTKYEINEHHPDHIHLDNYTQYAPAMMVYCLHGFGIKGKHNVRETTGIYALSQLFATAFIIPIKHMVREERPDSSNRLSFPSGHTAIAFSSAQLLFQEYRDKNFWLSISGYPFAIFTGIYRTLNNKHWIGDVITGAGFGILSTQLAYCLYPAFSSRLTGKKKKASTILMPFLQNRTAGITAIHFF